MTQQTPEPWDDHRLTAAFVARSGSAAPPNGLIDDTLGALRELPGPVVVWRRSIVPAAVLIVALAVVGGGLAMFGGSAPAGVVTFRGGPSPDLRTLDAGTFAFDFPADWLAYEAGVAFSGGSSIAVLGTQVVEARCGTERHVDINCVYEQPLGPGDVRVYVGTGAYRGGTILDRPGIDNGTTSRLTVGDMPAILDEYDPQSDSFYKEDASFDWSVAFPKSLGNVVAIRVRAREWPFRGRINTRDEVRAATAVLIDSFRFTPPPARLPGDETARNGAAVEAIRSHAEGFRRGFVGNVDSTGVTYIECLGDEPEVAASERVRYGPGGYLDRPVDLVCSWTIGEVTPTIWRLELSYDWTAEGRSGRYTETLWLDGSAGIIASTSAGDPPDSSGPPATALGLEVVSVPDALGIRDVGVDDRELAVRGWFQPTPPIPCPAPTTWPVSPVEPNCPDQWVVLMAEDPSITTVEPRGFTGALPTGAFFQLDLDDLDVAWQPPLPALGPAPPIELVVIGHFDDRRSFACPDALEQACRDRFVVDRVESVDGAQQATSVVLEVATPSSTAEEVRAVIADAAPGTQILSMALVDGASGIGRIEPALGTGQGGFIDQAATWVVRGLRDERTTTLLVVDGTDAISEMTPDNVPVRISGSVPTPSIRTPTDAYDFAFSLTSEVAAGRPPAQVAVVDLSGRVTDAREALPEDPRFIDILGPDRVVFLPDPRLRGRFHVVWVGGVCDGSMVVSIDAAFASILVDGGYQPGCDAMGIERHIVLDVDGELDPAVVETRYTETRAPAS